MKAVLQRVKEASVTISGNVKGKIDHGLLIYLGVNQHDAYADIAWLTQKIVKTRIFSDKEGLMNLSIKDVGGDILVISQFTLCADTRKGNRPSFSSAAKPDKAIPLYNTFLIALEKLLQKPVQAGTFGADMQVHSLNDGPVTILFNSKLT